MIDYDKLLDTWAEAVQMKIDRCNIAVEALEYDSYKHGNLTGYVNGLYMAMSMLSTVERRYKAT